MAETELVEGLLSIDCGGCGCGLGRWNIFFSGIPPTENWLELALIIALFVYLHAGVVAMGADPNNTLSAAVIFPVIYLYGTTPGMLMGIVAGIVDGRMRNRGFARSLFNSAQLALGALVNSLLFVWLGGLWGGMALGGAATNVIVNTLLVSLAVALWGGGTSWRSVLSRSGGARALPGNAGGTAFIGGVIFTLFFLQHTIFGGGC